MGTAPAAELREETQLAAQWVLDFAAGAYGPNGSYKLVQGADGTHALVEGGASALREARPAHAAIAPYLRLVESVGRHAGDQATAALLLAAQLVHRGLALVDDGAPVAAVLDGYRLGHRQVRAVVAAQARAGTAYEALGRVSAHAADWASAIAAGLEHLVDHRDGGRRLDLDRVDVRVDSGAPDAGGVLGGCQWLDGVVVEPRRGPRSGQFPNAGVLVLDDGRLLHARSENVTRRLLTTRDHQASVDAEDAEIRVNVARVAAAGVRLLVCRRSFEESVADALEAAGLLVWSDANGDAIERLCQATGAQPAPGLRSWSGDDVGRGDLSARRRPRKGWLVAGPGAAATLAVPAGSPSVAGLARDEAERLLRAAGCFLDDARVVPGGGRWQRMAEDALRRAAPHAPGKAPLGIGAAADAVGWLADRLVVNAGLDPLDVPLLADADDVWDGYRAVRLAIDAAFEAAAAVLRVDGRYARRTSRPSDLRGSKTAPVGPASGNWMDVPRHQ